MRTLSDLITQHDVDVLDHLDREVSVPVLSGLQFQGDVAVIPSVPGREQGDPVPAEGVPVVRGENGGNTHTLLAEGSVAWAPSTSRDRSNLTLGWLTVAEGATAYLAHPEHGYSGIAPGSYELRRQREQREEIELVQD